MKKKIAFYSVIGLVSLFITYIIIIALEPNPITLNYKLPFKTEIYRLTPQGWAFFTKDVHKDYFLIYNMENTNFNRVDVKSSSIDQLLGMKRENRSIRHKINYILDNINNNLWYDYQGNVNEIHIDSLSKVSITAKEPMIYGDFLIEKGNPMPYEWYKSKLSVYSQMSYIILSINKK